ncbi:MAG: hypothetical protein G01um101438_248 [Parcubacteria group bacterium Gr01-1014_38]|nr:MAG: hypothetical protein G01um101438_248 [Parcubacteria group bacterium Gr01-1014_38]
MPPHSKRKFLHPVRGDTSVILMFLILSVLLLGATALTVLSVGNLRSAGNIVVSSQALYAADTGIERGMTDYRWSDPNAPMCTAVDNAAVGTAAYQLVVQADNGSCPRVGDLQTGARALCIEAVGKVRGGTVRRRVTSDSFDPTRLTNPCRR